MESKNIIKKLALIGALCYPCLQGSLYANKDDLNSTQGNLDVKTVEITIPESLEVTITMERQQNSEPSDVNAVPAEETQVAQTEEHTVPGAAESAQYIEMLEPTIADKESQRSYPDENQEPSTETDNKGLALNIDDKKLIKTITDNLLEVYSGEIIDVQTKDESFQASEENSGDYENNIMELTNRFVYNAIEKLDKIKGLEITEEVQYEDILNLLQECIIIYGFDFLNIDKDTVKVIKNLATDAVRSLNEIETANENFNHNKKLLEPLINIALGEVESSSFSRIICDQVSKYCKETKGQNLGEETETEQ
ncbi:MAG: hypothetical protein LBI37_02975 [Puniceicoccales bacterium]|jgi:hypothetical protein|nr:hypothetical protein [Puniceicoccales bacterium]